MGFDQNLGRPGPHDTGQGPAGKGHEALPGPGGEQHGPGMYARQTLPGVGGQDLPVREDADDAPVRIVTAGTGRPSVDQAQPPAPRAVQAGIPLAAVGTAQQLASGPGLLVEEPDRQTGPFQYRGGSQAGRAGAANGHVAAFRPHR